MAATIVLRQTENCACYAIELFIKMSRRKLSHEYTLRILTPKIPLYSTMVDLWRRWGLWSIWLRQVSKRFLQDNQPSSNDWKKWLPFVNHHDHFLTAPFNLSPLQGMRVMWWLFAASSTSVLPTSSACPLWRVYSMTTYLLNSDMSSSLTGKTNPTNQMWGPYRKILKSAQSTWSDTGA